ncbi:sulfotransferase family protein [Mesorhizobium sp. M7A.F.Ca.US.014.04.1.1]|uniref:Sulfotransferase n=1 Tax=Mesorhizobium ciceri biovar biserrulae (strain HAMBI 2942 / LMG 23838 / WSM1271) TaxID=765698 RepID=E8TMK4_MESCW|nr:MULTISPECIES: sulfotransferase [Mesorhizobium]ADV13949.1 sulfotransferase [Mesorhizobium ciceri biovar biserrulae WSM1271]AMX92133.1 sulfotransferase [Mesorhizobium ciceri]MDF3210376.1 tetratricopeptide repeat protein [Mesorhizobium sp. LMG15046]MDF3231404.1 tetratricopeptide repeat protein [Mesorhizobium sp. DSM 30133]RUU18228.1 sulfotransferase family protein [Mesorhizobium sp. Primo-B]
MNNRLPPAWSKHLKVQTGPKPKFPQPNLRNANSLSPAQADDALLEQAYQFQQAKRLNEAQDLCLRVLARTPNHPLALYILGTVCLGYDDEAALRYFARAIGEEPKNPYYHLGLASAYVKVSEYSPAIEHMQYALELQPGLIEALCALGDAYIQFDKPDMALPLYEKALKINRDHPKVRIGLASALSSLGRMDEAAAFLKEAIERRIAMPTAYNDLVQTQKFTEEPKELQSIVGELGNPKLDLDGVEKLHLAAGKVLNDLKRYKDAFGHFNKAKQASGRYFDIDQYRRWVDSLIETFTPEMLAARSGYGNPSEVPVFVVGMPRSGTTLTEQICASHPDVHGAGELSKLRRVANAIDLRKSSAGRLNHAMASITEHLSGTLAEEHLTYLRERAPAALRIVDKMPHNFELIGLIAVLFPNARIIHCRRDAIDNCVSCFVQKFGEGHSYNTDLKTLGLYYREYDRLMQHWNEVFPNLIFENQYETLVDDQEAQSRRLIDYLGLPWDDACLRFFDRDGSVNTPSRWQVRQPIYKSSVKRWKNYEGEIQPLIDALGDLADT